MTLRTGRTLPFVLGLLAIAPSAAFAHTGAGAAHGFVHGFQHPLFGWDHLLAMVAVGLWAAQVGGRRAWALPAAFVVAMLAGGALALAGVAVPGVEPGIVGSVLVLGALIATAARVAAPVSLAIVAVFAIFHGHAHGAEMPATVSGLVYAAGFATATAMLHAAGVLTALGVRRTATEPQLWIRIAGATISAAGVALLIAL